MTPACFGLLCPCRGRCARYLAVDFSTADAETLVTCRQGDRFPLFMVAAPLPTQGPVA